MRWRDWTGPRLSPDDLDHVAELRASVLSGAPRVSVSRATAAGVLALLDRLVESWQSDTVVIGSVGLLVVGAVGYRPSPRILVGGAP